jgi:hypothetical protein
MVNAQAQENVPLKAGAGRDVVEGYCGACHSLDYPRQNVLFLNRQGWETEVNKMIKTYGAPIPPADAKAIGELRQRRLNISTDPFKFALIVDERPTLISLKDATVWYLIKVRLAISNRDLLRLCVGCRYASLSF